MPKWRKDGKEILFSSLDVRVKAAEIALKEGALEVGQIRTLFSNPGGQFVRSSIGRVLEVTDLLVHCLLKCAEPHNSHRRRAAWMRLRKQIDNGCTCREYRKPARWQG